MHRYHHVLSFMVGQVTNLEEANTSDHNLSEIRVQTGPPVNS